MRAEDREGDPADREADQRQHARGLEERLAQDQDEHHAHERQEARADQGRFEADHHEQERSDPMTRPAHLAAGLDAGARPQQDRDENGQQQDAEQSPHDGLGDRQQREGTADGPEAGGCGQPEAEPQVDL
ncbi:MAG: hypothetical protein QNK03_08625, partial [Myxococcota bacterium]|nr:hypothetical protein [Myxococcota bacterium]